MLVEGTLFAAGLVLTVLVGAPIASRAANPSGAWSWLRRPHQPTPDRPRVEATAGFTPLDLGPDPIQWPSQRPWPNSPLTTPQWPSQTWDDEHFGAQARKQALHAASQAEAASQSHAASRAPARPTAEAQAAEARFFHHEPAATPAGAPRPAANHRAQPKAPAAPAHPPSKQKGPTRPQGAPSPAAPAVVLAPQVTRVHSTAPPVAPQAARAPATRATEVPTREELEAMITQIGLAGTVQRIMERTGWDFRQAAQYLARIRQGQ